MAQSGPPWEASPHTCGNGGHQGRIDRSGLLPSYEDEAADWETDPDGTNDATERGFWWGDGPGACSEISTASIISALSHSIRGCELHPHGTGKPGLPPTQSYKDEGHQHPPAAEDSPLQSSRGTLQWSPGLDARAPLLQPYPSVYLHSSAAAGIQRASVFECNAAEKLDTFFYEKLKACEESPPQPNPAGATSGTYENEELLGDEPGTKDRSRTQGGPGREGRTVHQRERAKQGSLDAQGQGGRHRWSHARQTDRRRDCTHPQRLPSSGDGHGPSACNRSRRTFQQGDRAAAEPGREKAPHGWGCNRPGLEAGGLPQVLPRCAIAHLQSCAACQQFNRGPQAWPGEEEVPYENSRAPREEESTSGRQARSAAPSQRQLQQRLSEVQKWLEQSTAEEPSICPGPETHGALSLAAPGCFYACDVYGTMDQTEGGTWRKLEGDGNAAEPRAPRGRRRGNVEVGNPARPQPVGKSLGHTDLNAASIPHDTCSCLFRERQRRSTGSAPGRRRGGHASESRPGACSAMEAAAAKLPAESRVQRIVEAFERRSRREAKMAAQERLLQAARQREPDGRARAVAAKEQRRARPRSGSRPPRSHSGPRWREAVTEGRPQGSRRKGDTTKKKKGPSFVEKLNGLH